MKKSYGLLPYLLLAAIFIFSSISVVAQCNIITTVAGSGGGGYGGDGGPATSGYIYNPYDVAYDAAGTMYIADYGNNFVRKVTTGGIITQFAGTGYAYYGGDGATATLADITSPSGVVADAAGNIYISDFGNNRIRKVNTSGIISTVVGNGSATYAGDGGYATAASINGPMGISFDAAGNLYIADYNNNRVRKVSASGIISTIAGTGTGSYGGDGGSATSATMHHPFDVVPDASGNVYISDYSNHRVRMVNTSGIISTIAGTGTPSSTGDGSSSTGATLNFPAGLGMDGAGNLYISEYGGNHIRKITTSGIITNYCGAGGPGYGGDGGNAATANLNTPLGISVDATGNIIIADKSNYRIRKISSGNPAVAAISGASAVTIGLTTTLTDATSGGTWSTSASSIASVNSSGVVTGVAVGNGTISYSVTNSCGTTVVTAPISVISNCNIITTIAGTGSTGFSGDGGAATAAQIYGPQGVAVDASGNVFIADANNNRIRKINTSGVISTYAGVGGSGGFYGDGGQATSAILNYPIGLAIDASGNLIFSDASNNRIRKITPSGIITTIAGTGSGGYSGDGGAATAAQFNSPMYISLDATGNLFIADMQNNAIRKIDASGIVSTVAGTGSFGFSGDGGAATAAQLYVPNGVKVDAAGNIYIADYGNYRIRKVTTSGIISTVAGTSSPGYSGDGGAATAAQLYEPNAVDVDASGSIYISDYYNHCVRMVSPSGIISTVAGTGSTSGTLGDSGPATGGTMFRPVDVFVDGADNLWITDQQAARVRKVTSGNPEVGAILGATFVTVGSTTTLIDTTTGGSWSSSATSIASVSSSGDVTGVATGTAVVSYSKTSSCGTTVATKTINVYPACASIITTVAGTGIADTTGDGGAATAAPLMEPNLMAIDVAGNVYIAEHAGVKVRKISPSGIITTVAGTTASGFAGDGGPATAASLNFILGVAVDATGNLFISDYGNQRVRKVNTSGIISTIAGTGTAGFSGDGGQGTAAMLNYPTGLITDASGNLYISDAQNNVVRKLTPAGIITTFAGGGGSLGDGGPATAAAIAYPMGLCFDASGNLLIADQFNYRIRKVTPAGIISTFAGSSSGGFAGDGGAATAARLNNPSSVYPDGMGNIYVADYSNNRVRKISTSGIISTISGNGSAAYAGNDGPATAGSLYSPMGLVADPAGNVYVSERYGFRVRKISSGNPIVAAISGATSVAVGSTTTLTDATSGGTWGTSVSSIASVNSSGVVTGVASGNATISYSVTNSCGTTVMTLGMTVNASSCNIIYTLAGTGSAGYSGDGGAAYSAHLNAPEGIAIDAAGNRYIADYNNNRIRKIDPSGVISTIAGTGTAGFYGDGGQASAAYLQGPAAVAVDKRGNMYISDAGNYRVRKINTAGVISTIATGYASGGICADSNLNVYIISSSTVMKIDSSGGIGYFAGGGVGYSGDGGPATAAQLHNPVGLAADNRGNIFIADRDNYCVRRVAATGIITTYAGTGGSPGWSGDGGPATAAQIGDVSGVAVDAWGNVYTADLNYVVRKINASGTISTFAGSGSTTGAGGDGGPATAATVRPYALATDISGNVYIVDMYNNMIREVVTGTPVVGAISGATSVTIGSTTTLTDATSGGTWSTSASSIASVNSSGVVTGVAAGSATISYSVTNSCGTTVMTLGVTVSAFSCNIITTIAGNGTFGYTGDGGAATTAQLGTSYSIVYDASGNLYITDASNNCVRKVNTAGVISTFAGNGTYGYSGDGGPATAAHVGGVYGVCVDNSGNVYIADRSNQVIRKVTPAGIISTFAGGGSSLGDGGPATAAMLTGLLTIAMDAAGNMYVVGQDNGTVRKINTAGIISLYAGNYSVGYSGDGGPATAAKLNTPTHIAIDGAGNLFIADPGNERIRKVTAASGIITTVAGNGTAGSTGDGGSATSATLGSPSGIAVDGAGNLFISVSADDKIRKVNTSGIITTYAGTGSSGYSGDGGPATAAALFGPLPIITDATGNIYFADYSNRRIRKITSGNRVVGAISGASTITVGSTTTLSDTTSGGSWSTSASSIASVNSSGVVTGVAAGNATISYSVTNSCGTTVVTSAIAVISTCNIITTIAGTGTAGFSGDGSAATAATVATPAAVAVDRNGNIFFTDQANNRIRKVTPAGIISTYAGTGTAGYSGDGGQATAATFSNYMFALAADTSGNLYVADRNNSVIRKIATTGIITTVAGNGSPGFSGDGGPATSANLSYPCGVSVDNGGNLYIADQQNNRIRKVNASGIISTIAGTGSVGFAGDGGQATAATFSGPSYAMMGNAGEIYISDQANNRIRKIAATGIITTIAGTGTAGHTGDGGPATSAAIYGPDVIIENNSGNIFVLEQGSSFVRQINSTGIISTYAGSGSSSYSGDGGPATAAGLSGFGICFDLSGNILIADMSNNRIRKITSGNPTVAVISGATSVAVGSTTTLADATSGGTWGTNASSIASVNSSGVVTGVAAGSATISYSVTNSCGTTVVTSNISVISTCNIITTIAGTGSAGYSGDGGAATAGNINDPVVVTFDRSGNMYISDFSNNRVRKITSSGSISTFAGSGTAAYSGDGGAAASAALHSPNGIAFDGSGNTYIVDEYNECVRKVTASGIISTFAGIGTFGFSGDGGPATAAKFDTPEGIAIDASGNVYIADQHNHRIRKISTAGIISTFAGTGTGGFSGDGGPATAANLYFPSGLAIDVSGNIYVAEPNNNRIRKINTSGVISTIAGNGSAGFAGDGSAATLGQLSYPTGVAVDAGGNIYIADNGNQRTRKVNTSGILSTLSGTGTSGYSGDGGSATGAQLSGAIGVAVDSVGNVYIVDNGNNRIRKITSGNPSVAVISGATSVAVGSTTTFTDATSGGTWGTSASSIASVNNSGVVTGVAAGSATISYSVTNSCGTTVMTLGMIVLSPCTPIITTIAGTGTAGYSGDGGAATAAELNGDQTVAVDGAGNIYLSDFYNNRIRKISASGVISTVAGTGTPGFSGDGGPATAADIYSPYGVAVDGFGNLYFTDVQRIRKVTAGGIISTIAGGATAGYSGDGGPATAAMLNNPYGLAVDGAGNVYIADNYNYRIRKISVGGIISTIAGNGTAGYSGDGGAATAAELYTPTGVAVDGAGNIYVADVNNFRIRKVTTGGIISTIAGRSSYGFSGDGGPATAAELFGNWDVAVDAVGNVYIADDGNKRIRKVNTSGIISTIAGNGTAGYTGDGGPATSAELNGTQAIAIDGSGNIYLADGGNYAVRKIASGNPTVAAISGPTTVNAGSTITLTDATSGGTWSTSSSAIASVNSSGTATVLGVAAGVATISYSVTNSCGTTVVTHKDTVISATCSGTPTSGSASASVTSACSLPFSSTITASGMSSGTGITYKWQSSSDSISWSNITGATATSYAATVASSPTYYRLVVTCTSSGLSANSAGVKLFQISLPVVAPISGATSQAVGSTITLTDATSGGTWSTGASSIASVNSAGVVTGVAAGVAALSYSVTNSCGTTVVTHLDTVISTSCSGTPTSGSVSASVISSCTLPFSSTITGSGMSSGTGITYQWQSSSDSSTWGNITGATAASYGASVATSPTYYRLVVNCSASGLSANSAGVKLFQSSTVSPGSISGPGSVCTGSFITLTDGVSGGTWSSASSSVATVSATGVVTGVSVGAAVISYTVTNSCGTASAVYTVNVSSVPLASAISGPSSVCVSSSITLTDTASGGVWTSSNSSVATVNSSTGSVTGVASGAAIITFTKTNSCGTAQASQSVSVGVLSVAAISGSSSVCIGGTVNLTDVTTGGTWTSSNNTIATVSGSGVVTGVGSGADTIFYSVSGSCGSVSVSKIINSSVAPTAGTITGISAICQGAITTLSDATSGGSWSSSNNAIATVNSSGVVTGVSGGNATISYTVSGSCGSVSATKLVLITPLPSPGTITGTMAVCVGSNTTLADTATGGTWTSGSMSLATVNSSGVVTGVATGTATISYTKTNSCGSATTTASVAVQTAASAGTISGTTHICAGLTSALSETVSGGVWSSSNSTIASINSSTGVMTGVAAGSANITYTVTNSCGSVTTSTSATIDPAITTGTITGTPVVCPGATTSLSDAVSGGAWSSSNSSVATVSSTGTVTGVATGTSIISYTITNTCGSASAVDTVTVSPAPTAGTITGTTTLCTGATVTLSDAVAGGTWASSNTAIATVNASGIVRGVTAGTVTISYTATNSCGTATATQSVTVNTTPSAGSISGSTTVCPGVTTTLVDGVSGGTWSSSNTTIASINSSGVVRGISAGTVTISYIVTTSCGTGIATMSFSVTPSGSAGTITGTTTICTGTTSTLADATSGGTWSSGATGIATVSASGVVRGVSVGSATISYTVASSCGTASATKVVSIITTPSAGTITGTTTVCAGSTTTLSDTVSGGSWTSSNAAIATVNASGVVTGVAAGTATITYAVSFTCGSASATKSVTVNPLPVAGTISGTATICTGTTSALSSTSSGGTWSSSNTAIATVSASGVVTAVSVGSATISYAVTNSCGTANSTYAITVITGASAGTISGASAFCAGTPSTFTETVSGGTWSSSNTAVATVSASGLVVGVSGGSVTISYGVTSSCATAYATKAVTINPTPVMGAITGSSSVCVSSTTTFTDTTTGGTWMSSNNTIATVSTTGMVTGVSSGTATISYYKTNSCGTSTVTLPITVGGSGSAGTITGTTAVCTGSTSTLADAVSGGTWSSSNTAVATVSTTGVVTGVSSGTAIMSYTVSGGCGTSSATATVTVSSAVSAGTITGTTTFCAGTTSTLTATVSGGIWSSGNPSVATVNASGVVTGVMGGSVIISYTVTSSCGSSATATTTLTVNALPSIASISGVRSLCMGTTATLTDATGGGTWSSSNTSVASISTTGTVTAVATGTTIISYAVTNSCGTAAALDTITVNATPSAGSIAGSGSVCIGSITTLSDIVTGGVWSSSSPAIASVSPTGVVAGISTGTTIISYTVTNSCGTAVATMSVTVSSSTSATISGTTSVCAGATSALSASVSGGVWSSSNNTIATVNTGGTVTGVTAGTVTISYMVTTGCGSALAMTTFTVTSGASAGTISGAASVCVASVTTLTDGFSGGSWSSSNTAVATIDASGNVTGVSAGSVTISYTVSGSCGTALATHSMTVGSTPSAGFITGATALCTGSSITLVDATSGGTWSSSSTSIATVSTSGVVTGITTGSVTISYTVTSGCGTAIATTAITVGTGVSAGTITGATTMCAGSTSTLAEAVSGGTWSSSNPSVATINTSGTVTGVSAGTATISYTVTGSCGSASATTTVVINPMPSAATITGTTSICLGTTTTLSDVVTGGTWSSTNTSIATISSTGVVTSVATGTTTISYTVVNSCGTAAATVTFTVGTAPSAGTITGAGNICSGTSTTLSDAVAGGSWSSSNPAIATINSAGVVTGSGAGAVTISYTVTNSTGCSATAIFGLTVGGSLASSSITPGGATLCGGSPVTLTVVSTATGLSYQWYKNGAILTGATTATYLATTTGVYKAAIVNTCASDTLAAVTIVASPNPVITVIGAHTLSTGSFAAYQWYFNGSAIPGATNSTYSYSVGGVYTVRVTDGNGCSITSAGKTVTTGGGGGGGNVGVAPVVTADDLSVYPNPATSMIHINAPVKVNVAILTPLGKVVIEQKDAVDINMGGIADGLYMIMIYDENNTLLKAAKLIKLE